MMAMQKLFNNLLIPVVLNRRAGRIVENAMELANRLECNLHILYTIPSPFFRKWIHGRRKRKMSEIQQQMSLRIKPGLLMQAVFTSGNFHEEVKNYVLSHEIDLVSIQNRDELFRLPGYAPDPERLALEADCAVISNEGVAGLGNCDKIILPIGSSVPINGVRVAVYLARQFDATIHLVTNTHQEDNLASLQRTYQLLKDNTDVPVVCNTFSGSNFRQSVFNYARSVHAGLIVANPACRMKKGFFNWVLAREYAAGKVAVMTVD